MNPKERNIGDALLAQLPQLSELPTLRTQALAAMEKEKLRLKRRRIAVQSFWIFCAVTATAYMWFGPESAHTPRAPFLACLFLLWGGIEVLKYRIHSSRVEILAEVKQLQLQVLELTAKVDSRKS